MRNPAHRLIRSDNGATAIEYVLLAGLLSIAAIAAMTSFGDSDEGVFRQIDTSLGGAHTTMKGTKTGK